MSTEHSDDLVLFEDVRIVQSTATALQCRIGTKVVWLPRRHVAGKLWRRGDRGKLLIRQWIARDRHLIDRNGAAIASPGRSGSKPSRTRRLHLVRDDRTAHHGQ